MVKPATATRRQQGVASPGEGRQRARARVVGLEMRATALQEMIVHLEGQIAILVEDLTTLERAIRALRAYHERHTARKQ